MKLVMFAVDLSFDDEEQFFGKKVGVLVPDGTDTLAMMKDFRAFLAKFDYDILYELQEYVTAVEEGKASRDNCIERFNMDYEEAYFLVWTYFADCNGSLDPKGMVGAFLRKYPSYSGELLEVEVCLFDSKGHVETEVCCDFLELEKAERVKTAISLVQPYLEEICNCREKEDYVEIYGCKDNAYFDYRVYDNGKITKIRK